MKTKNIKIKLISTRYELKELLFAALADEAESDMLEIPEELLSDAEGETFEISSDALLTQKDGRVEISYDETELTGMEGSRTAISYDESTPGLLTMVREGTVSTALVFEQGKRHHCVYNTPYMPFQICVHTLSVDNKFESEGKIYIDYVIEIRGARAERTKLELISL